MYVFFSYIYIYMMVVKKFREIAGAAEKMMGEAGKFVISGDEVLNSGIQNGIFAGECSCDFMA